MNTCTDINWFQILCFSLVVLLGVSVPASGSLYPHGVVLISWDGVSKSILLDLLEKNSLPNLSSLVKKGSFVNISITDHYPDTMAGHAQILTGYSPEQTGVFKSMRYGEIPEGLTIFERLEDAFGPENISTVIVASQERSLGTVKGLPFFHAGNVVDIIMTVIVMLVLSVQSLQRRFTIMHRKGGILFLFILGMRLIPGMHMEQVYPHKWRQSKK
jgi:hypothetical protein